MSEHYYTITLLRNMFSIITVNCTVYSLFKPSVHLTSYHYGTEILNKNDVWRQHQILPSTAIYVRISTTIQYI
jgi:hypothetical protein